MRKNELWQKYLKKGARPSTVKIIMNEYDERVQYACVSFRSKLKIIFIMIILLYYYYYIYRSSSAKFEISLMILVGLKMFNFFKRLSYFLFPRLVQFFGFNTFFKYFCIIFVKFVFARTFSVFFTFF